MSLVYAKPRPPSAGTRPRDRNCHRHTFTGLVPDVYVTWLSADEHAACRAQATAAGRDFAAVLVQAEEDKSAANWRKSFAGERDPNEILLVAEQDGAIVGYALGRLTAGDPVYRAELCALYILPAHHGQGIGRRLVQAVAQRLAIQGIHSLHVGVLRVNPNRPFYARLGGQYLYDRDYEEGGFVQPECVYGWQDTQALLEIAVT